MIIEVNKWYRTRDGRRAFVIGRAPDECHRKFPLIGLVPSEDGAYCLISWTDGGTEYTTDNSCSDLVSEWREPVSREVTVYLLRTAGGIVYAVFGGDITNAIAKKTITITEGEGMENTVQPEVRT